MWGTTTQTKLRYYREGLPSLQRAVDAWRGRRDGAGRFFVLQLGDLLDMHSKTHGAGPDAALDLLLRTVLSVGVDVHHCIGEPPLLLLQGYGCVERG
jgi:hypothetical protein